MAEGRKFNTSFLGGEVGDRFMARVDTALYDKTLRILENFLVHPTGGLDLDPGTVFLCEAKTNTGPVRLMPFEKSSSEKYVLELTELACRFYRDKARIMDGANPLEIVTAWLGAKLEGLRTAQNEDSLFVAHKEYQLSRLKYFAEKDWRLSSADFDMVLVIAHSVAPYATVYSFSDELLSKKTNPFDTAPGGIGYACAFSEDGQYLAIGHVISPFISIYKRSGVGFTKLANPDVLPSTGVTCVAFSHDGQYMAIRSGTSLWIYKRNGDAFSKLADPSPQPAGAPGQLDFSSDGMYLAVAHPTTPFVSIYKKNGDSFEKLSNPDVLPGGQGIDVSFSPDTYYLAVTSQSSAPYFQVYKRNNDTFTKLSSPTTVPAVNCFSCRFSRTGQYLAVSFEASPYWWVYKQNHDSFTKLANPPALTGGWAHRLSWYWDDSYIAMGVHVTPFVHVAKRTGDTFSLLANPDSLPTGQGNAACFVPDGWEGVSWGSKFPGALSFHDQRLLLGRDQVIRGSRVARPQDFRLDAADESAGFEYSLAGDTLEEIMWMRTKAHNIVVGTTLGEWLLTGGNAPITGSNVFADRVSGHGSAEICAILGNESLLYVQKGGQRLREFLYSQERGGYISPDLTLLADHIGELGFQELAWQRSPSSMLWTRLGTGELASLTLDRNNSIVAWGRHPRDGIIKSLAIVSGDASNGEDTIYMCVQRVINGVTKQYIEYMTPQRRPADETDWHFVDCGKIYDYSATTDTMSGATQASPVVVTAAGHPFANDEKVRITGVVGMTQLNGNVYTVKNKGTDTFELYDEPGINPLNGLAFGAYVSGGLVEKVAKALSGLEHLEAKTVAVYADGVELGQEVVSSGAITIDAYAAKIHVGLPYTGKMWTQRLGHFSPVRIPEATLLLYKSRGGKIGSDEASLKAIRYDTVDLKTGAQRVTIGGRFSDEGSIMIVQDQPLPMSILGIVGKMSVGE